MWCAGANATVREYVDGAGANHKIITFKAQPGMTPEMALFYQAGSFPQNINLLGKKVCAFVFLLLSAVFRCVCGSLNRVSTHQLTTHKKTQIHTTTELLLVPPVAPDRPHLLGEPVRLLFVGLFGSCACAVRLFRACRQPCDCRLAISDPPPFPKKHPPQKTPPKNQKNNSIVPNLFSLFNPSVSTLIHEAYRNDPGPIALSTKMWVDVINVQDNLRANRTLAGLKYEGIVVWRLLVTYKDTPEGCVVECEYVLGAPEKVKRALLLLFVCVCCGFCVLLCQSVFGLN